jgi:uncharacterized protein (TIGR03067 family)
MWFLRGAHHSSMFMIAMVVAVGTVNGQTDKETPANQIARLIEQLGNDDFAKRETASKELEAIGEPALSALRRAAVSSPDAEIQWRAERVVQVLAARVGQKELAKWDGYWKDPNGVWIEFSGARWSSGMPNWGPIAGRIQILEVGKDATTADLLVDEGPNQGHTCQAIFYLDGDTLQYCGTYSGVRPTEFKTATNYLSCTFKRSKK